MGLRMIHDFIQGNGYDFEPEIINGKWQKLTDKNGHKVWYVGTDHGDDLLTFSFGDFREPDKRFTFCSKTSLTPADQTRLNKFTKRVEEDKSLKQAIAQELVQTLWGRWELEQKPGLVPEYLINKKLPVPPGVLIREASENRQNILVIPLRDQDGELWNIQQIYASGDKPFFPNARVKGCFYTFGGKPTTPIMIGEGFATCAAAHLATGNTVICAFNISNLEYAVRSLIDLKWPAQDIVMLADWDGETFKRTGKNPGMLAVQKLTKKYKVGFVSPVTIGGWDENVDFADVWDPKNPEVVKRWCEQVQYYADISADVYSVKKSEDVETLDITHVPDSSPIVSTLAEASIYKEPEPVVSSKIETKLEVKRLGAPWSPVSHKIDTRKSGFHTVETIKGGGVRYVPNYPDLRLLFEETHPFVTHRESEVVYAFTGQKYEMVPEIDMASFAEKHFDPKPTNHVVREFIGSVTRYNVRGDEFFDTHKRISFANGWLDLETMEFRPHGPQVGFKNVLGYEFDPDAVCPEWDAFLGRVLCDDPVLIQMLMEYLGYILSGDECWAQVAMVLKGEGSNGKSTLLKGVRALIGKPNLMSAKVSEFKSEYTRQLLDGKLANISEETPKDALLDSSIFKDIVSGGTIQVRAIYGSPYSLDVRAKLLFSCNDMPPTGDNSWALLRRLLIVPFNATFTKETADPFMDRRLLKELPGIFNKSLLAYLELVKRGHFEASATVHNAVKEYQKSTNPVISWLDEKITVHEMASEKGNVVSSVSSLFANFKMYCDASGFKLMNVENFAKQLRRAIPDADQRAGRFGKSADRFRGLRGLTSRDGSAIIENGRSALDF